MFWEKKNFALLPEQNLIMQRVSLADFCKKRAK
jgi:hypothetical protein